MVGGEHEPPGRLDGVPVVDSHLGAGSEHLQCVATQGDDHCGLDRSQLALQPGEHVGDLGRFGVAVAGRPCLDHVGDEHRVALQSRLSQQEIEQPPG